jgi:hypothetical protein
MSSKLKNRASPKKTQIEQPLSGNTMKFLQCEQNSYLLLKCLFKCFFFVQRLTLPENLAKVQVSN